MMKTVTVHDAKTQLSRYLAEVEEGAEIVIARGKRPVARLVPLRTPPGFFSPRPRVGTMLDTPASVPAEALRALSQSELRAIGL